MSSATTNMMIWMTIVADTATVVPSGPGTIFWNAGNAVSTTRTTPARKRYALRAAPFGSSGRGSSPDFSDFGGATSPALRRSW